MKNDNFERRREILRRLDCGEVMSKDELMIDCPDCGKPLTRPPYTQNFDLCRCNGRNAWLVKYDESPEGEAARREILRRFDHGELLNKDALCFDCPDCGKPLTRPPYAQSLDLCTCNGRNGTYDWRRAEAARYGDFDLSKLARDINDKNRRLYLVHSTPQRQQAGNAVALAFAGMAASAFVLAALPWAWWLDCWADR